MTSYPNTNTKSKNYHSRVVVSNTNDAKCSRNGKVCPSPAPVLNEGQGHKCVNVLYCVRNLVHSIKILFDKRIVILPWEASSGLWTQALSPCYLSPISWLRSQYTSRVYWGFWSPECRSPISREHLQGNLSLGLWSPESVFMVTWG